MTTVALRSVITASFASGHDFRAPQQEMHIPDPVAFSSESTGILLRDYNMHSGPAVGVSWHDSLPPKQLMILLTGCAS